MSYINYLLFCLLLVNTLAVNVLPTEETGVLQEGVAQSINLKEKIESSGRIDSSLLNPENSPVVTEAPEPESTFTPEGIEDESWLIQLVGGLGYSFGFIFLSELGDKTFLFVIIYATRMNAMKLFLLASMVLCAMHVCGVALGGSIQLMFSTFWIKIFTIAAFFLFGVVLLYQSFTEEEEEEDYYVKLKEVEEEANIQARNENDHEFFGTEQHQEEADIEGQEIPEVEAKGFFANLCGFFISGESIKVILTLLAFEMGDRSQVSAFGLGAQYSFWVVAVAGALGHMLAVIFAILFGKAVANHTTEKCMNIIGGILFLIFSAYTALEYFYLIGE